MKISVELQNDKKSFFGRSPFVAYQTGVAAAALSFITISTVRILIDGKFESATGRSYGERLEHLALMMGLMFVAALVSTAITAFIPFCLGWFIAKKMDIRHWLFFVLGAALTGILLTPLFASIPNLGINVDGNQSSFTQQCLNMMPMFAVCGAVAGIACWRVLRRK